MYNFIGKFAYICLLFYFLFMKEGFRKQPYFVKWDWTLLLPFLIFALAFVVHYVMVISYYEDLYQYHSINVKESIINSQKAVFEINLIGNSILFFGLIVGVLLVFNIGLLFYNYAFSFKELCALILKCSIWIALVYLILPLILYLKTNVYSFQELYTIESSFTLSKITTDFSPTWFKNVMENFSISQLVFIILLIIGFRKMMNWTYKKASFNVLRIYAVGFLMWNCFTVIMDMNFYE